MNTTKYFQFPREDNLLFQEASTCTCYSMLKNKFSAFTNNSNKHRKFTSKANPSYTINLQQYSRLKFDDVASLAQDCKIILLCEKPNTNDKQVTDKKDTLYHYLYTNYSCPFKNELPLKYCT